MEFLKTLIGYLVAVALSGLGYWIGLPFMGTLFGALLVIGVVLILFLALPFGIAYGTSQSNNPSPDVRVQETLTRKYIFWRTVVLEGVILGFVAVPWLFMWTAPSEYIPPYLMYLFFAGCWMGIISMLIAHMQRKSNLKRAVTILQYTAGVVIISTVSMILSI